MRCLDRSWRHRLSTVAMIAMAAGLAAQPAAAQSAGGTEEEASETGPEIVVTARKRDERLQDVPITIDVLSGDTLAEQGVQRPSELQFAVPGFVVQNFETRATITLRGVGAQIAGGTSSVATHVNGIYQASSAAQLNRMFDVERVEVLKGPQGTLYGRNSTGGALNLITKGPGSELEGNFSAGFGRFDTVRLDGAVTVPLSEDFGVRFAGSFLQGDGQYLNRVTNKYIGHEEFFGGRMTLGGTIGAVKAEAFVQYTRDKDDTQLTLIPITPATAKPQFDWNQTVYDSPLKPDSDREMWLVGVNLSGDFTDTLSWRSISGFLDYGDTSLIDVNPVVSASRLVIQTPQQARQWSQEFQFLYSDDSWDAVLGLYYLSDKQTNQRFLTLTPPGLVLFDNAGLDKTNSYAAFLDVSYSVTDQLTLNVGGRINHEKIRNTFDGNGLIDGVGFDLTDKETSTTWKLGLQYEPNAELMFFGSVSTGFQAGFSQTRTDAQTGADRPDKIDPEKLTAYEAGLKWIFPARNGYFNLSGFYYDYRDMQVNVGGVFLRPDGTLDNTRPAFFFTTNAGKARIYGIDAQISDFRLGPNFRFDANAEYLNAKFKEYDTVTNTRLPISYRGNTLPRAPKFTASTALTLDNLRIAEGVEAQLRGELNYRSRTYFTPDNSVLQSQGALTLINASGRIEFNDGQWAITATGRNLTNRKFFDFYGGSTFGNTGEFRTWEVGVDFKF